MRRLKFIIDHPVPVLALFALLTLVFLTRLPQLKLQSSIYDLAIEDLPETNAYREFKAEFGTEEIILVRVKSRGVFEERTFEEITALSAALAGVKGVRRVISLPRIKSDIDVAGELGLAEFAQMIEHMALFDRVLLSTNKTTLITLVLADVSQKERIVEAVAEIIQTRQDGLSLYQIGLPVISSALAAYTERDFLTLPPICFLVIACVLWVIFRSFVGVFLPLGILLVAVIWTLGLMAWTGTPLSMVTMIVPVLLIAVGTAYCLHILSAVTRISAHCASSRAAVIETYGKTAVPTLLAVLTTVIGLGALLANRIIAIREFALFSCFGTLSLCVLLLGCLPAVLSLLPTATLRSERTGQLPDLLARVLERIVLWNLKHHRMLLGLLLLLSLVLAAGALRLRVETNPLGYFRSGTPVSRHFQDVHRDMAGSAPMNVVMEAREADAFENPRALRKLSQVQDFLGTLKGVDATLSFADYVRLVNYVTNKYRPEYYTLPEEDFELRMLINSYKSLLGMDTFRRFMNAELSKANILLQTHLSGSHEFLAAKERILAHVQMDDYQGFSFQVTGFGIVIAQSSRILAMGQIKSLSVTLGLVFAVMFLLFMSVKVGLVAMIPNLFPIVVNFGLMGWLGIDLSYSTALIAGIALALAVDDTIHYLFRYNLEFKRNPDKVQAMRNSLRSVGQPLILTSLTIGLGFFVLIFSNFKPTAVFGILMVITILSALAGNILLLPGLMLRLELVTVWDLLRSISTLDRMTDAVAHELNQPLNTIKMGNEFLKVMVEKKEPIPEEVLSQVVGEIDRQVDRAAATIQRVVELGRGLEESRESIDLNDLIRGLLATLGPRFALLGIKSTTELARDLPRIEGQKIRIREVLFSVLTNAVEAMERKAGERPEAGPYRLQVTTRSRRNHVTVTVADNGIGMFAHEKKRAFEPFFTTRVLGKGKGLGLAIAHGIMREYAGRIELETEKWSGTTVTLAFPRPLFDRGKTDDQDPGD